MKSILRIDFKMTGPIQIENFETADTEAVEIEHPSARRPAGSLDRGARLKCRRCKQQVASRTTRCSRPAAQACRPPKQPSSPEPCAQPVIAACAASDAARSKLSAAETERTHAHGSALMALSRSSGGHTLDFPPRPPPPMSWSSSTTQQSAPCVTVPVSSTGHAEGRHTDFAGDVAIALQTGATEERGVAEPR